MERKNFVALDDLPQVGPWMGVPDEMQNVCAVEECKEPGKPRVCSFDGSRHHHGCVHYKHGSTKQDLPKTRDGWCWLCDTHDPVLNNGKYRNGGFGPRS